MTDHEMQDLDGSSMTEADAEKVYRLALVTGADDLRAWWLRTYRDPSALTPTERDRSLRAIPFLRSLDANDQLGGKERMATLNDPNRGQDSIPNNARVSPDARQASTPAEPDQNIPSSSPSPDYTSAALDPQATLAGLRAQLTPDIQMIETDDLQGGPDRGFAYVIPPDGKASNLRGTAQNPAIER